jgi:hypothetical protein
MVSHKKLGRHAGLGPGWADRSINRVGFETGRLPSFQFRLVETMPPVGKVV